MQVADLVSRIRGASDCVVHEPAGLPAVLPPHRMPDDLLSFYRLCGGLVLHQIAPFPALLVPPAGLVLANPVIVGELGEYDISSAWYILSSDGSNSQIVTIDLAEERLGRCYDSFWDRHAVAGSSTVIARSFSEFLQRSFENDGQDVYWHVPGFVAHGDAYDPPA